MNAHSKSNPQRSSKLFGVALDPADDTWSLQLKRAWMTSDQRCLQGLNACLDPYDALTESLGLTGIERRIKPTGKFPVPSWLWPKPPAEELPHVNSEAISRFFDEGNLLPLIHRLQAYVATQILPDTPIMIGIDHSATAGVIAALAEHYGAEALSVLVLDQHCDAIPLPVRMAEVEWTRSSPMTGIPSVGLLSAKRYADPFCCGNFWAHLIDTSAVLPENLIFIGVADYPEHTESTPSPSLCMTQAQSAPRLPHGANRFGQCYLDLERSGCTFFPRSRFDGEYLNALRALIHERVRTPYLYVSLDLDVASYNGTFAARYMDRPGISRQDLLEIAGIAAEGCRQGRYQLAGLDVVEFNTHFLGLETPEGIKDETVALARDFILTLT